MMLVLPFVKKYVIIRFNGLFEEIKCAGAGRVKFTAATANFLNPGFLSDPRCELGDGT